MISYFNPVRTVFGPGAITELPNMISAACRNAEKVLLINRGGNFSDTPECRKIMELLSDKQVFSYDYIVSNPDLTDILDVYSKASMHGYDIVVAVGGGSVMDTGKAVASFRGMEIKTAEEMRAIVKNGSYAKNPGSCKWIGIPTTSGTGSEVTPWAAIWDREMGIKVSIDDPSLYSFAAIVDPELTLNLPIRVTVSTALDAMSHATEAYWAKRTNPISRIFAVESIKNICGYLGKLVDDPKNLEYRTKIAAGSLYAGLSFSNTRSTACHSISYPLTLMFNMEHGIAAAITLAKVMKVNEPAIVEKQILYGAFNGAAAPEQVDWEIEKLYTKGGLPYRLTGYGAKEDQLDEVVRRAYTKGRMDNNPVEINASDLRAILGEIL